MKTWISVLMLLLLALVLGWVPLLGSLLLGFLAGRAAPGVRGLLIVLPALAPQTGLLLAGRWMVQGVATSGYEGWLWTALSWLSGPLSTALGRALSEMIGRSDALGFALLFTLPALPGLLLGNRGARRARRW